MNTENTSKRLKKIMEIRNLRQADILNAAKPYCRKYNVKINRSDLSQYISGLVNPRQDKLHVLSLALNVSPAWLMGFDVPMHLEENSPAEIDEGVLDEYLIRRLCSLSPEELAQVDAFVQGLLANRKA